MRTDLENGFRKHPRLKDQIARLSVKREPRYVDVTLTHGLIKARRPLTAAVIENFHVV